MVSVVVSCKLSRLNLKLARKIKIGYYELLYTRWMENNVNWHLKLYAEIILQVIRRDNTGKEQLYEH